MSMHTPGPWHINKCRNGRRIVPADATVGGVAHVYAKGEHDYERGTYSRPEEMEANARLIAAAPELLEALRCLISWADMMGGWESPVWERAEAAVAYAEGKEIGCQSPAPKWRR